MDDGRLIAFWDGFLAGANFMASQPTPAPNVTPPRNKGLIRPYEGKPMVNKPLIRPYLSWGYVRGG